MKRKSPSFRYTPIRRIEICGGIASGKTTFARLFKDSEAEMEFERFKENPFWRMFYENPAEYAFATEIAFFLQHYIQIKRHSAQSLTVVCDFSLLQDRAYADVNLRGGRLNAFNGVYRQATNEIILPSLIVRLKCSAREELNRIRRRARAEERGVQIEYLEALNRAIERRFKAQSANVRTLTIDSEVNDFAHSGRTRARMVERVLSELENLASNDRRRG